MNADVNGAVNIRRKITQSPPTGDMSNGWLAQPGVFLFDQRDWRVCTARTGSVANPNIPTLAVPRIRRLQALEDVNSVGATPL